MSIPDFQFDPPTGHNNTEVFPEYPARDQVRPLFQRLFDQIRDFINTSVKGTVNTHLAEMATQQILGHVRLPENWIDATLVNGWTGSIKYSKDDFGLVTVTVAIRGGTLASNTKITNMPLSYSPVSTNIMPIPTIIPATGVTGFGLYISNNGGISVRDVSLVSSTELLYAEFNYTTR